MEHGHVHGNSALLRATRHDVCSPAKREPRPNMLLWSGTNKGKVQQEKLGDWTAVIFRSAGKVDRQSGVG